jgi:acetylornithine deacetylase
MLPAFEELQKTMTDLLPESVDLLCDIIRMPSVRGAEGPVNRYLAEVFAPIVRQAKLMAIPDSFQNDSDYRWPLEDFSYEDTENLRLHLGTKRNGKSLLLNAHVDVVPPSQGQDRPWEPQVTNGVVIGRGACDDKGQIAVIYLALKTLNILGLQPAAEVTIDLVVEEENGGNGTLWMTRHPVSAQAAIVMEPTRMRICPAVRGAVWFTLTLTGRAGHSGSADATVSAIKLAQKAMVDLEKYHDDLLVESRGHNPLFDAYENPMPITFGQIQAGDWPATSPAQATVKGVFGFLPNKKVADVHAGMQHALANSDDPWLRENFQLEFNMLNSDGFEIPEDHPMVTDLISALQKSNQPTELIALTGSCDAFMYNNIMNIPTVVFGAGDLWKYAHANNEQINIEDIQNTALVILNFIADWCGLEMIK